jgi:hypothetical protein
VVAMACLGVRSATAARPGGSTRRLMYACGNQFCLDGTVFYPYGATLYQSTKKAGIDNPAGAVSLAQRQGLNAIRIVDFFDHNGDPRLTPFDPAVWAKVDALIGDAQAAHLRVLLDLSDYKAGLWNSCIDPYSADWTGYLRFVANRTNTVTGQRYRSDPEIALVTFTGEPLPVGSHSFVDKFGARCTITCTTRQLTRFYAGVEATWKSLDHGHLIAAGGLGYVNEPNAGIDWKAIFGNPNNDVCAWKTYGGMFSWLPAGAGYCNNVLHKPWFNDEWGYMQSLGDSNRAVAFVSQFRNNHANNAAGNFYWNANYLLRPSTYDVGPGTPLPEAAVRDHSRPPAASG